MSSPGYFYGTDHDNPYKTLFFFKGLLNEITFFDFSLGFSFYRQDIPS